MSEFTLMEQQLLTKDMTDNQKMLFMSQYSSEKKDSGVVMIAAIFSLDRFFLGQPGLGILKIISIGGYGIWWLIDLFTVKSRVGSFNRSKATEIAMMIKTMGA